MADLEATHQALTGFLTTREGRTVEVGDLQVLTGGMSLVTIAFSADGERYVLRMNPPSDAALTQTDRSSEAALLQTLTEAGSIPMPALRWADPTGEELGVPALIIEHVDGPQLLAHLRAVDESEHPQLALDLAEAIATVHVRGGEVAPAHLERPDSWDAYIDSFIAGWRAVEAAYPQRNPFLRWLADWLDGHRPAPAPLTLVHGEFQTGNVMLDSSGAMQVIDWEWAHIGDPRVDLGWIQTCAAFAPPDPIAVDPEGFCRRYRDVSGLGEDVINPLSIAWFGIAGGYRSLGGLLGGIGALAAGDNHLLTSAYLVSAIPFSHQRWREGIAGIEAALAMMTEATS